MFVCVCVCFLPIYSKRHVRWMYQPGVTQEEVHTGFILVPPSFCGACLYFSREKDSAVPFPRRPFCPILCTNDVGFTYLQYMDFQREPQSKHHLYCEQEKPAHCHGSLLLRLGTHQIQNRTRYAHKISPHGTMTKRTPAMNRDHAVSWGGRLG